ncbi:hypothetical protein IWQ61_009972 [Dispira simplex]|nr:hypothetical protein IWQ61_009972 [Dispira simplex]
MGLARTFNPYTEKFEVLYSSLCTNASTTNSENFNYYKRFEVPTKVLTEETPTTEEANIFHCYCLSVPLNNTSPYLLHFPDGTYADYTNSVTKEQLWAYYAETNQREAALQLYQDKVQQDITEAEFKAILKEGKRQIDG